MLKLVLGYMRDRLMVCLALDGERIGEPLRNLTSKSFVFMLLKWLRGSKQLRGSVVGRSHIGCHVFFRIPKLLLTFLVPAVMSLS